MSSGIPTPLPIDAQLRALHASLRGDLPGIARIALVAYDAKADSLETYAHSTSGPDPLAHYEARLSEVPSLAELARTGRDRVIDDLAELADSNAPHSRAIAGRFRSSYTRPLYEVGRLRGFVFFDADEAGYFTQGVLHRLVVYGDFVALLLASHLFPARLLESAVEVAARVSHSRDPETGAHLDRMARFSRAIATELADERALADAWIEHLFLFAPLHDLGKVAIPDAVLRKPDRLTADELLVMRSHVTRGRELVDRVLRDTQMDGLPYVDILRNLVLHHHECWDGSGYPSGLAGEAIPLEARIVKVADVFDALTSERVYKAAWDTDSAIRYLRAGAGRSLDPGCVAAFERCLGEIEAIRRAFRDVPEQAGLREGYDADL